MMEEIVQYQENIDNMFNTIQAEQAQINKDLTDNVQNTIDGHSTQMGRVEQDIQTKNKDMEKAVKKVQSDLTMFIKKLDQQPSLSENEVNEIVNAAQVTIFDKQLEM